MHLQYEIKSHDWFFLSPLTAAATSWTGWAMSSLTSKFYKPPSTAATPSTGTVAGGGKQQEAYKPEGMREHPVLCVPACSWCMQLAHSVHQNVRVKVRHVLLMSTRMCMCCVSHWCFCELLNTLAVLVRTLCSNVDKHS